MTDRKQFEAMLEALINEDQETAKEIFHNIVVAKSREIYEELLESDFNEEAEEEEEESTEESYEEEGAEEEESAEEEEEGSDDEEGADFGADDEEGSDDEEGDASDDFAADLGDEGEESEGDVEARVMDLEDALDELKAEFEQLMASEEEEGHHDDLGGLDAGAELGGDEFGGAEVGAEEPVDELTQFMEYVDKVALPKHGDNGANPKSVVASKNDMGGTTANIANGGVAKGEGTKGGLANPKTQEDNAGNINVPGGNAGKTAFKKKEPGHGAEKKGSGDTAPDKKSIIGSRK